MHFDIVLGEKEYTLEIEKNENRFDVTINGEEQFSVDAVNLKQDLLSLLIGNKSYLVNIKDDNRKYMVDVNGETFNIEVYEEGSPRRLQRGSSGVQGKQVIKAPMPGKVIKILVKEGDEVEKGKGVAVIEAMKMENELKASANGTIKEINVEEGKAVNAGDTLIVIE
ncbi:MAG: biotin/lipoyl-binding protein [Candidatus Schekmanbacteria bacterium]|nr:biotin/lipoyl-binding protein [Candidatus Schekmanbacteria bacterium]